MNGPALTKQEQIARAIVKILSPRVAKDIGIATVMTDPFFARHAEEARAAAYAAIRVIAAAQRIRDAEVREAGAPVETVQ